MEFKSIDCLIDVIKNSDLCEYRALPFWSWNDKLEKEELKKQIRWMKEQGFGGYFMHARGGLITEYLGKEWFECIEACLSEGDSLGMESWIYDENGWPSGFAGGKLLEKMENRDCYLTYVEGKYDPEAFVSYICDGDSLIRTEVTTDKECLNVYRHYSTSSTDVLNPEVVDKFIALTHEKYKNTLGKKFTESVKGFFSDEPQYYRWAQPYTKMVEKYFNEVYGENVLDGLGLLFVEKRGYKEFRYKFWKAMQSLLLENFAKRIYEWCEKNGVQYTGHYVEETSLKANMLACGGIMPFYEFLHIPGIDHLSKGDNSPLAQKQVYSVAKQLGKKRVLTETFGCCGWDATPKDFKRIAEKHFVGGVNLICQHLLPYSERGQRKRDYPAHFSPMNPWVKKDYKSFNDYFARLGYLLGESDDETSIALFNPIRSVWLDYKRADFDAVEYESDVSYAALAKKLSAMSVQYHVIDETVMEKHARIEGSKFIVGNCAYKAVIFPKTTVLGSFSKKLFDEFIKNGGKVLFTDGVPIYLEGIECDFGYRSNTTLEEIVAEEPYFIDDYNTEIQSVFRSMGELKFIYAVNLSDNEYDLTFNGDFNGFNALDLETLEIRGIDKKVHFGANQSYVLFLTENKFDSMASVAATVLKGEFEVTSSSGNYLTLDSLSYSTDGVNFSDNLHYMGVFNELLNKRYNGYVYLKYTFEINTVPQKIDFLSEDMNTVYCECNGERIEFCGISDFDKAVYRANIAPYVKKGMNEIVIKINFYQKDTVYYVLFGENINEGLKNCLTYDTTVEACYLQGDFGVYAKNGFSAGKNKNVLFGSNFYIDRKITHITELVESGYTFFAGEITLKKEVVFAGGKCIVDLKGRFSLSEISVNGKKVKKSYFSDKVDISDYVVRGKNVLLITLWIDNRNLLGSHHYKEEIPLFVGPAVFELEGTWINGKSSDEREDYCFIRSGLFE